MKFLNKYTSVLGMALLSIPGKNNQKLSEVMSRIKIQISQGIHIKISSHKHLKRRQSERIMTLDVADVFIQSNKDNF